MKWKKLLILFLTAFTASACGLLDPGMGDIKGKLEACLKIVDPDTGGSLSYCDFPIDSEFGISVKADGATPKETLLTSNDFLFTDLESGDYTLTASVEDDEGCDILNDPLRVEVKKNEITEAVVKLEVVCDD